MISVTTENKFFSTDQTIMIKTYQSRKEGLKISSVYPSDEPNPMGYHRNTLLYPDEGKSKASKPDEWFQMTL